MLLFSFVGLLLLRLAGCAKDCHAESVRRPKPGANRVAVQPWVRPAYDPLALKARHAQAIVNPTHIVHQSEDHTSDTTA
jgi:hypothetical protein